MPDDGTITANITTTADTATRVQVGIPLPVRLDAALPAGRYFLVRCGAQDVTERMTTWDIYARRPLYAGRVRRIDDQNAEWTLVATMTPQDPGMAWLQQRQPGEAINLIGPLGSGFGAPPASSNTLIVTDPLRLPILFTLIEAALDRGGRITLIVADAGQEDELAAMRALLPIAVELHAARDEADLVRQLEETLVWADRVCVALPTLAPARLAQLIRDARMRLEEGFAHVLVEADLLCGYGACLACVVPTAGGGLTRACVHGPVFDLTRLG